MKMTSIILRSMSFPRRQLFLHTKKRFGILFLSRADRSLQDHGHGCCCARHNWKVSQTSVQGSPINRKVCCDKSLVPILGDKPSDSFNWFLCLVFSLGGLGLVLSIVKLKLQEFMPKIEAKDHHQEFASIQSQSHETSSVEKEKEDNNTRNNSSQPTGLPKAVLQAKDLVQRIKDETGSPGLVIAVSVDGERVWSEGFGYADVENRVPCTPHTVMRIASISKAMTMTAVARLWEQGRLDLDKPVQHYIPQWPVKTFEGKEVTITTRQLVSHMGGIRHYDKNCGRKPKEQKDVEKQPTKDGESGKAKTVTFDTSSSSSAKSKPAKAATDSEIRKKREKATSSGYQVSEFEHREYYLKKHFNNVTESLELFKNDQLCFLPGSSHLYSSHGWTLVSAVMEGASGQKFPQIISKLFRDLGLEHTCLDLHQPIIYNRARYYDKNKNGRLVNTPYVDNSYKWAGGGFLSDIEDLIKFGNAMLYAYQWKDDQPSKSSSPPGFIKPETVDMLWTPVIKTKCSWGGGDGHYGMGWGVFPATQEFGHCRKTQFYVNHTGGAIGASSVLLVLPSSSNLKSGCPSGVVVAIMVNLTSVSLAKTALEVAKVFEKVDRTHKSG